MPKRPSNFSGGWFFKTGRALWLISGVGGTFVGAHFWTEPKLGNLRGCGKGAASGVAQTWEKMQRVQEWLSWRNLLPTS